MDEPQKETLKKKYDAPRLVEYGDLKKLTQGGGGTRKETSGKKTKSSGTA